MLFYFFVTVPSKLEFHWVREIRKVTSSFLLLPPLHSVKICCVLYILCRGLRLAALRQKTFYEVVIAFSARYGSRTGHSEINDTVVALARLTQTGFDTDFLPRKILFRCEKFISTSVDTAARWTISIGHRVVNNSTTLSFVVDEKLFYLKIGRKHIADKTRVYENKIVRMLTVIVKWMQNVLIASHKNHVRGLICAYYALSWFFGQLAYFGFLLCLLDASLMMHP